MAEESDVTVVSSKGQVVIPLKLRKKLGIKSGNKLAIYGDQDAIIMRKLEMLDLREELKAIYDRMDKRIAKYGELSEQEIVEIIQKYRRPKETS
jgi:AbrB family looped-hinge helix DNA binding protein